MTEQTEETKQPQDNDTNKKVTVSMRGMDKLLWLKAGYQARLEDTTLTQYVSKLIEENLSNK